MSTDELSQRIARIHSAVDALLETDVSKFPARRFISRHAIALVQDFSGGMSPEAIANVAQSAIYNIAHFEDHLRRFVKRSGREPTLIDTCMASSFALRVIKDLSNNDKHGYPPRDGGYSRRAPRIAELSRVMRLTTKAKAGSSAVMTLGRSGEPVIRGSGSGTVVITGQVVDRYGVAIGDLYDLEVEAVTAWEQLLRQYGISIPR